MKPVRHLLLPAAIATILAAGLSACGGGPRDAVAATPRKPVIVMTVRQSPGTEQRVLTATVRARVETELGFRTGGKVVERLVDVGARVESGQVLARLDVTDNELAVQSALDQVRAATVDAEQAASDEARMGRLLDEGSVGAADHERQKARADAAAARLDQARRGLSLAHNRADYTTLRAPYAGLVTGRTLETGQVVGEGQPVFTLARQGEREIVADVPESLIDGVRELRATAVRWQGSGEPIPLRLREVAPMASAMTGTFRVRYAIDAPADAGARELALGATMQLRLERAAAAGIELPASALVKGSGAPGVWVVDGTDGGLRFERVQVQSFGPRSVRVEGLADGARVVTVGAQKLDAALKVTPVERQTVASVRS
jgi:RND family efflux transporter MFP subunit